MRDKKEWLPRAALVFCAVLTAVLSWRWQRIFYLMCANYILSDMPIHIRLALGHNDYSLASLFVRVLWWLFGEAKGQTALSLLLTGNQLLGLATLWLLLRGMFPRIDGRYLYLAALLAHLCGPWIFPGQTAMYLGSFNGAYNGNIYHNMTMLFSRTLVPPVLLFFFRLWESRRGDLRGGDWLGLMLCLLISTLFKPSFLGAFAPAVFVMLVWDFCATKCGGFKNEFLIGLAFIPSLIALVWSASALYAADFAGTSSSVTLRLLAPAALLSLLVMYLRGLLLPVWTFTTQGRREDSVLRGRLRILASVLGVAILEALTLTETGFRVNDGNYEWGSLILYAPIFSVAIALLLRMVQAADMKKRPELIRAAIGIVLLLGHLVIGVYCLSQPGRTGYDWFYF